MSLFSVVPGRQYQRKANIFEQALDIIQTPNFAVAGAVDAALAGENPIAGAGRFIKEKRTFSDVLENRGVTGPVAQGLGLTLDIVADPTTYVGLNTLTSAGRAARGAKIGLEHALMQGDDAVDVFSRIAKVAETGVFGESRAAQAANKHRVLLEFAGRPVVYGEKVFEAVDRVTSLVGESGPGRALGKLVGKKKVPEALKLRHQQMRALVSQETEKLAEEISDQGSEFYRAMADAGVDSETAKMILRDATERWKPTVTKYIDHMTPHQSRKYARWTRQAELGSRGIRGGQILTGEDEVQAFIGQAARPTNDATTGQGRVLRESISATDDASILSGRKKNIPNQNPDVIPKEGMVSTNRGFRRAIPIEVNRRGNETLRSSTPNVFTLKNAWDFQGPMPDDLIKFLPENTQKAVRRTEEAVREAITAKHINRATREVIEKYGHKNTSGLLPIVSRSVHYINKMNAAYLATERKTGLVVEELVSNLNYLRRSLAPEAVDAIGEHVGMKHASSYEISARFAAQLQRDDKLRNLTITEINELAESGQLSILGQRFRRKVKLFEDEPFHATFIRGTEGRKAVESAKTVRDAANVYGKLVDAADLGRPINFATDAPLGQRFLSNRLAEDMGLRQYDKGVVVKDMAFPHDIADMLESHYERVISPQFMQPFLRGYDAVQRIWKNITLPIWPAYHARNLMSDFFIITHGADEYGLSVLNATKSIKDASYAMGKSTSVDVNGVKMAWDDWKAMLDKYGVLDYSGGRDMDDKISRPFGLPRNLGKVQNLEYSIQHAGIGNMRPVEAAVRAGTWRQNAMNSGYFLGLLRQGVSPEVAALEVKKRLFDFSDLTDTERQILRRIFPFYSWLRHNLPYQIQAVAKKPRILGNIQKLRESTTEGEGPAGDVPLPEFLAQGLPLKIGEGQDGDPVFARLQGLLPAGDLAQLGDPIGSLTNMMSPFLKAPVEIGTNYNTFQKLPLERYPGEQSKILGVSVAKRFSPVIDMIRPIKEAHNLFGRAGDPEDKAMGLLLSKGYEVDRESQLSLMGFKVKQEQVRMKKLLYKAAARGDVGEIARIRKHMNDLYTNPSQVMRQ